MKITLPINLSLVYNSEELFYNFISVVGLGQLEAILFQLLFSSLRRELVRMPRFESYI